MVMGRLTFFRCLLNQLKAGAPDEGAKVEEDGEAVPPKKMAKKAKAASVEPPAEPAHDDDEEWES